MTPTIRPLKTTDVQPMWAINEQGLPGVGKVTPEALADILSLCTLPLGAFDGETLMGFVLCMPPDTRYGSLNYRWFHGRYPVFLYVDRIAVGAAYRDLGVGTALYGEVLAHAAAHGWPVAAEVSKQPPNPGSMRFHGRHGFTSVGVLAHGDTSVTMMLRPA